MTHHSRCSRSRRSSSERGSAVVADDLGTLGDDEHCRVWRVEPRPVAEPIHGMCGSVSPRAGASATVPVGLTLVRLCR